MDRDTALADFDAARAEWEGAFARVPDDALTYLKPGDDYALGGLQVHVNWVLAHYRRILDGIVKAGFAGIGPQDPAGAEAEALAGARRGLQAAERRKSLADMTHLHAVVHAAVHRLAASDWARKAPVVYGAGQEPYPTSPEDILGWLRDHYREHVEQSAALVEDWRSTKAGG
ncbi:MAG TPA: DinB family protein [Candidatus Dormibacteraeota bacterium]